MYIKHDIIAELVNERDNVELRKYQSRLLDKGNK